MEHTNRQSLYVSIESKQSLYVSIESKQSLYVSIESKQSLTGFISVGGSSQYKTYILRDRDGRELVAVASDEEVILDATANDIRIGKTAATDTGITIGEKVIPSYHTTQGFVVIPIGEEFTITVLKNLDTYDYTKLEAMICDFNTSLRNSVATNRVVIDDNVYEVQSTESLSVLVKNHSDKTIDFGITNETGKMQILRFFTYKEIE